MMTDALTRVNLPTNANIDFESIFAAHFQGVYRLVYRIVGEPQEAEDLTQEAFLRLYRQRFAEGEEHNVRAWVYRVATNLAYNAERGRRRREVRQENVHWDAEPENPADAAMRTIERDLVRQALDSLPERQQQLLMLRHAGLSYREVAEALDIAPASVGTMLARAHKAFETAYKALDRAPAGDRLT